MRGVSNWMFSRIWWYIKLGLCTLVVDTHRGTRFASQGIGTPTAAWIWFWTFHDDTVDFARLQYYNKSSAMLLYCQYCAIGQSCLAYSAMVV